MAATVETLIDRWVEITKATDHLTQQRVLVGIPSSTAGRRDTPITNAQLGYIHEYGAPEANIPPRPFLRPGVSDAKDQLIKIMRKAGTCALEGKPEGVQKALHAAGLVAVASVQKKIVDGPFVPLSPRTLAARRARGVARTKPLIDTGQLRQAITYVIRKK